MFTFDCFHSLLLLPLTTTTTTLLHLTCQLLARITTHSSSLQSGLNTAARFCVHRTFRSAWSSSIATLPLPHNIQSEATEGKDHRLRTRYYAEMPTMDRIAPELQHMIFAAADESDIPNLRLTCKALAGVGLQYLFSEIDLGFHPDSLDHLEHISQHPARHHVRRLNYNFSVSFPSFVDQQGLREVANGRQRITSAISQLAKLRHLSFDLSRESPYGLQELLPVFLAIDPEKTTLQSLELCCVWQKFNAQDKDYNLMTRLLSTLKAFQISVLFLDGRKDPRASYEAYVKHFQRGCLLGLVRLMPCLQVLDLSFASLLDSWPGVRMKSVIGDTCWSALREIVLRNLQPTGEDLLRFFERHAETLRAVKLGHLKLLQGMWSNVFKEMRNLLKLEECTLVHLWNTSDSLDNWGFFGSKELQDYVLRKEVSFEDAIRACRCD